VLSIGERVIVTDRGWMSHTVRVLSGQLQGCVSDSVMESVGDCKEVLHSSEGRIQEESGAAEGLMKEPQSRKREKLIQLIGSLFVLVILFFLFSRQPSQTEQRQSQKNEGQTTAQEATWIEKGKEAVRAKMKDPASTQFRNVFFHRGIDSVPMTCGEVSGKTRFGGDGGFQRFVSGGKPELTYLEDEVTDFSTVWEKMCQ